ncbi:MAG: hypothetical protein AAFQ07_20105, partial [Chloroflexota bacterium]
CYEARGRVRAAMRNYEGAISDYETFLERGGGYEFDNQSDIQSLIITLRFNALLSRFIPTRFLPKPRP